MRKIIFFIIVGLLFTGCANDSESISPLVSNGEGGSLARFTIGGNFLYVVTHSTLHVFDISDPNNISKENESYVGFRVETIFPYNNKLFIGSEDAMYIYDISEPSKPQQLSIYNHITACDPVVVQGNFAYVSLRGNTDCQTGTEDLIEKVNVSDPTQPSLVISTNDVLSPYGLGVKDQILYVCQGKNGLRMFNINDLSVYSDIDMDAYDVIVDDDYLILTGRGGISQFDISDAKNPILLSQISTEAK